MYDLSDYSGNTGFESQEEQLLANAHVYTRAGLVVHHWWIVNRCESQKKKFKFNDILFLFFILSLIKICST